MSSLEPTKLKYACQVTSPATGVQPITFIFDNYKMLEAALEESIKTLNPTEVEKAFHESRINTMEGKIAQHKERLEKISAPDYDPEEDNIEMEEV